MKKSIIIFSTLTIVFTLTAFGYYNWNDTPRGFKESITKQDIALENNFFTVVNKHAGPDFYYKIDSRFNTVISKEKLHRAKSIIEILPEEATSTLEMYQDVKISVLHEDNEIIEIGTNELLNPNQIELLQSVDYSTNIRISSNCKIKDTYIGGLEHYNLVYYMTVVPEKEAEFKEGNKMLLTYLKRSTKKQIAQVREKELKAGRITFTITKDEGIENIKLNSTSGYTALDQELLNLIGNMPNQWSSATNSIGEKVDQEFVLFFGQMGC